MVKKTWIVAAVCICTLLFVSAAGFADSPGPVSDEALAAILGDAVPGSSCAVQVASRHQATVVQNEKTCTATVTCLDGSTRSCSSASTNCTAVNPNCSTSLEQGHVTCNGVSTYCPACCNTGTMQQKACCRCDIAGGCVDCCRCDGGGAAQCAIACG